MYVWNAWTRASWLVNKPHAPTGGRMQVVQQTQAEAETEAETEAEATPAELNLNWVAAAQSSATVAERHT